GRCGRLPGRCLTAGRKGPLPSPPPLPRRHAGCGWGRSPRSAATFTPVCSTTSANASPAGAWSFGRSAGPTRAQACAARPPMPRSCGCRLAVTTSPCGCSPPSPPTPPSAPGTASPRCRHVSAGHRLAGRRELTFADIAGEPFVALPRTAGPLREFWLATDQRAGQPVVVAAEVTSADEKFEIISTGAAVALVSAGNAVTYSRP